MRQQRDRAQEAGDHEKAAEITRSIDRFLARTYAAVLLATAQERPVGGLEHLNGHHHEMGGGLHAHYEIWDQDSENKEQK